jgi:PIN domain nuclease of toxin-antitoxin system
VLAAQQLPLPHRDPVDQFLAATAQVMDLTLVTGDDNLLGLGTIRTMKN